jgi:N-acetylmuramoyl-L-alanine amidase
MRVIDSLIVHCSDSPNDRDIGVKEITEWHVKERHFRTVGYHYVIRRDGTVENGRDEFWAGAHVEGHNAHSIGICLVGRDVFTENQIHALEKLGKRLLEKYKLTTANVFGHRDFNPHKTCPNIETKMLRGWLK